MLKFLLKEGKYIKSNAWKLTLVTKEKLITKKYRSVFWYGLCFKAKYSVLEIVYSILSQVLLS